MVIVKPTQGITSFKEQQLGFYIMTFEFQSGTISRISASRILIQTSRWALGINHKKVNTQHGQILLK